MTNAIKASLPNAWTSQWKPVVIRGPARILWLSDLHVPFHDPEAVSAAIESGIKFKADTVAIMGDLLDNHKLSRHEPEESIRTHKEALQSAKQILTAIRKWFPKARIIFKEGNHEEWLPRYILKNAGELEGVVTTQGLLDLDSLRIEWVSEKLPLKFGKLWAIHGHEYKGGSCADPAKWLFNRAKTHAICGHFHRSGHFSGTTIEDLVVSCWSVGCLRNMKPLWMPMNDWNLGFAQIELEKSGAFHVQNCRIIGGRVW